MLICLAWSRYPQRALAYEPLGPQELPVVVGDDGVAERQGVGGDQAIVAADGSVGLFEPGADARTNGVGWRHEGKDRGLRCYGDLALYRQSAGH
jgi:hypothetical protein